MAIATLDRIATDVRDPRARSYIPLHRARRALMDGRAEEAERLIDEGVKLAWSLHDSTVPILAGAQLFALRRAQGRLGELENAVHQFADRLPAMPAWRCALAVLYLDDGREGEARRERRAPRRARLRRLPARQRVDDRDGVAGRALPRASRRARTPSRSSGCSRPSRTATSSRPRASSAARSRAISRCAPRRGPTGTSPASTWRPRGRRRSGYRSAPRSRCSISTRPSILARRAGPGDAEAARALLVRARERSATIGVPVMGGRLERVEEMVGATGAGAATASPAATVPGQAAAAADGLTASLRREGDVWRVEFEGRTRFVKDAKGLRHLALLLDNPGVEFHAVDIVGAAEGTTAARRDGRRGRRRCRGPPRGRRRRRAARRRRPSASTARASRTCAPRSRRPRTFNDPERAARAREEIEFIARELSQRRRPRRPRPQGGVERRARAGERDARGQGRHPPHRGRGRGPRRASSRRRSTPATSAASSPTRAGRCPGRSMAADPRPVAVSEGSKPSTSSSSARASAARSPRAAWPRRAARPAARARAARAAGRVPPHAAGGARRRFLAPRHGAVTASGTCGASAASGARVERPRRRRR